MIVVFDVGATRTRLALSEDGKTLENIQRFDTDHSAAGFEVLLNNLQQITQGIDVSTVTGGFPGQVDRKTGVLQRVTNMPAWNGFNVAKALKQIGDVELHLANDATMGALGEAHMGAGITKGVMVYVTVSSGVNAVRILNGVVDGTIASYDIGQQIIAEAAGKFATLESLIGGVALQQREHRMPKDIHDAKVWENEARYLAYGIYNTVLHWTPDVIVFGGSMMRDIQITEVETQLQLLPQLPLNPFPRLIKARLKDTAGLYGALALSRQSVVKSR